MFEHVFFTPEENNLLEAIEFAHANHLGLEFQHFMAPDTLQHRERTVRFLQEGLRDYRSVPLALHGPVYDINIASRDPRIRELSLLRYRQAIEAALDLSASHLVFHTQWSPLYPMVNAYEAWVEETGLMLRDLCRTHLEDSDLVILLENFLDPSPQIILDLLAQASHPSLLACLDIGHVHLNSQEDPIYWAQMLGAQLYTIHAHNNHGQHDDHNGLRDGSLDVDEVLGHLHRSSYPYQLTLELANLEAVSEALTLIQLYRTEATPAGFADGAKSHYIL